MRSDYSTPSADCVNCQIYHVWSTRRTSNYWYEEHVGYKEKRLGLLPFYYDFGVKMFGSKTLFVEWHKI